MGNKKDREHPGKKLAKEMLRLFGDEAITIEIKLEPNPELEEFLRKIEQAHKNAGKSKLRFRCYA
jgi:hypothetical protein